VTGGSRGAELAEGLSEVRARIESASRSVHRDPHDITLVVVTKTWPVSDLALLHELGVSDFAENKHQDAADKAAELADLNLRWHFVGQIQSNKAARIAAYADVVHSVDSVRVAQRLNVGAHKHEREVDCLVQVSLDEKSSRGRRGGAAWAELETVAAAIYAAGGLRLAGVMGVAPPAGDASSAYRRLWEASRLVRATVPSADVISAGMSGDFEEAIGGGATHVRVGSAILGKRPTLR